MTLGRALAAQLLASSDDGIVAFDRDCRYTFWSPAMERLFGMKASDVVGQSAFDLFPFLIEIGEDACLRRALAGEDVVSLDRPFAIPGSNRRGTFEARYGPLYDDAGAITGGLGFLRDITERKRGEELLRETETRFRNMADVAPVLLWMSGTDGLCTFFNQTWLDFTGRTLDEEWGVGWAEGVHFEDFARCMDTYVAAFNERRVFEMEYRLRRHDGAYRWILDRGTPRYTPDGTFAGYIGSCIDITERRSLEVELRRAVEVRDEFLSVASHELKTPLTSLQLQVDMLARSLSRLPGGGPDERATNAAMAVAAQTERLGDLVNVLLDVSRIASGRLDFERTDFEAGTLARDVVERWRPAALRSGSIVGLDCPEPIQGQWDRVRLEQVLNNLLANAVKYGQGKPIEVDVREDAGRLRIAVKDHGIGIAPADQERIFERFARAAPVRNYGGLGLGLWIARQIVDGLGGVVSVTSAPGEGATFVVVLPRAEPPEPGHTGAPTSIRAHGPNAPSDHTSEQLAAVGANSAGNDSNPANTPADTR